MILITVRTKGNDIGTVIEVPVMPPELAFLLRICDSYNISLGLHARIEREQMEAEKIEALVEKSTRCDE